MTDYSEPQVGITTCLDAIKSAFGDGGAIIDKIKRKRALKRADPPPRLLEETIDQAPEAIEREKQRGIARFGTAFEEGDNIAVIGLQQICIRLQSSLLEKLRNAAFDDDHKVTDFTYLIDVADVGRDRTIAALHELRQRLINAQNPEAADGNSNQESVTPRSNSSAVPTPSGSETLSRTHTNQSNGTQQQQAHRKARTWSRDFSTEEDSTVGAPSQRDDDDRAHLPHHRKRSSILHFLKHTRTNSSTDAREKDKGGDNILKQPIVEEPTRQSSTASPASANNIAPRPSQPQRDAGSPGEQQIHKPSDSSVQTKFHYAEWEDNPEEIWGSAAKPKHSLERRETMQLAPDQTSASNTASSAPFNPPSPVLTHRTNSNTYSQMQQHMTSTAIPTPNPDNDYLGFCKGAWKLQNGDRKAMSKSSQVEPWSRHTTASAYFLSCQQPRCAFRSSFVHSNVDVIWNKVFTLDSKGIKVRWTFLAKSHVQQKVVVKHQYSFKCLFCVFTGEGRGGVYHGMDYYLEHISNEHRAKPMNDVILYKTGCVQGRVAGDDEEFDINLLPVESGEGDKERKGSQYLSDDLMDPYGYGREKEANDSMFSNEPWNEGLSDFHYGGGMEVELTGSWDG